MAKIIAMTVIVLVGGFIEVWAQSQTPQGGADQNANSQLNSGGSAARGIPKPVEPKERNSGPPYGDCYLKCINTGNPADFCQQNSKSYCN